MNPLVHGQRGMWVGGSILQSIPGLFPARREIIIFTSLLGVTVPSAMVLSVLGLANIQRPAPAPNTCLKWILISSVLVLLTQIVVIITVELSNQEFLAVGR